MEQQIRLLGLEDFHYMEAMDTGIEDDYVKRIFERLVSGNNRLYGLFWDEQLVSVGGYSIFAGNYAMLGRMRSDRRYRGNDLSTLLMSYVRDEAFKLENIQWVGANTQEENIPARRVLTKLGFTEHATIHGATTKDLSMFETGAPVWKKVQDLERKKKWLDELYVKTGNVFPYQCYYPFPASKALFPEEEVAEWTFYENETATRVLITKKDIKKHALLQAIYPWEDLLDQEGIWETISAAYRELSEKSESETFIWMDLSKKTAQSLPAGHSFKLPSPWILHGTARRQTTDKAGQKNRVSSYE